jgi:hypothetical protein
MSSSKSNNNSTAAKKRKSSAAVGALPNEDMSARAVMVPSIHPPRLYENAKLRDLIKFLDLFRSYQNMGGTFELYQCLDNGILDSIIARNPSLDVSDRTELEKVLFRKYCPKDVSLVMVELKNERCPPCSDVAAFNEYAYMKFVRIFLSIMHVCGEYTPPVKECVKMLLKNTQPVELANYLRNRYLTEASYPNLVMVIETAVEQFKLMHAVVHASRNVFPTVKPAHQKATPNVQGGKPAIVNAAVAVPPVANANANAQDKSKRWPKDMCLGCGHVTSPPHRRHNCPYREFSGWCATGIPTNPLPLPKVALLTDENDDVCIVKGKVGPPNQSLSVPVEIGLDSMSAVSIVSPDTAHRLKQECNAVEHRLPVMKYIQPAGYTNSVGYDTELELQVELSASVSFTTKFAVLSIPVHVLISWGDIKKFKLFSVLAENAGVCLPKLTEIAPEDSWSEDQVEIVAVPADREQWQNEVISEFPTVFNEELPSQAAAVPPLKIELKDPQVLPKSSAPRRQSPVVRKFIADTVQDLLTNGFIVPSSSPVASPVVVVRTPSRDPRMCVDYREVNAMTLPLNHPLPNLKGILSRLRGHKFFCKLDLRKGYHQALVDPASRFLTAFVTEEGQFEYIRIPFGLRNAPAYFQNVISKHVLAGLVCSICEVYIDDVIVVGESFAELRDNTYAVLKRFADHGLVVHPRKWIFGVEQVEFLGHVVSSKGITLSDTKKQGLVDLQCPKDKSTLKSFIGLANYFRDFVPNFSSRIGMLTGLASPKSVFVWNDELQAQFEDVRKAILNAPMLFHIDYSLPLVLRTDASQFGVGGMLLQICRGIEQPICFVSKKLSPEARRWSTIDQEAFAIFYAVTSLRHYLFGHPFVIETDHNNLQYISKYVDGRVGRWRLALQEYDFIVQHIAGATNTVADGLSRCCVVSSGEPPVEQAVDVAQDAISILDPKQLIAKFHDDTAGHCGIQTTIKKISDAGHRWSTLRRDVVEFIHSCPICQKLRVTEKEDAPLEQHVIDAYEPFQEISLDSIVNLPPDENDNTCILVVIDNFTKFVELFAVADVSAITAAQCLLSVVGRYGCIETIRSDRGGQFVSDVFQHLVNLMGSKQLLTIGYRPQGNGIVERVNAEVIRHLSAIVHSRRVKGVWSIGLPMVQRIINATVHSTTGYAPSTLLFGQRLHLDRAILTPFPLQEEVAIAPYVQKLHRYQCEAIKASQEYLAQQMDIRVNSQKGPFKQFNRGDYVVVRAHFDPNDDKFSFRYRGPYLVTESHNNLYSCMDLRTRKIHVFDVSTLKLFRVDESTDPLSVAIMDVNEDIVDCIIGHEAGKKGKKSHKFRVQFMDGSVSLLPYMEVRNLEALDKYLQLNPDVKRSLKL